MPFPQGSIRHAVATMGDNWGLFQEPTAADMTTPNWAFRVERADAEIMKRCATNLADRGTIFDPRVWVGVPLIERSIAPIVLPARVARFATGSVRDAVAVHGDLWARSSLARTLQVLPTEAADWEAMAYRRHAYLGVDPAEVTA